MVGHNSTRLTATRLAVWVMLIAFSVVLLGETAHSTLYPWGNKPRVVSKVQRDTDDGSWVDSSSRLPGHPEQQPIMSSQLRYLKSGLLLVRLYFGVDIFSRNSTESNGPQTNESTVSGSGTSSE
jgi:hypothetical protein